MKTRKPSVVLLSALLSCRPASQSGTAPSPEPLSRDERKAVGAAEVFVRDNCYTRLPCDISRMQPEFMDSSVRPDLVYEVRHNQLKPRAYGISPGTRPGVESGWTVYFEPTPEWLRSVPKLPGEPNIPANPGLRGIYVNRSFQVLFVEHLELRRDAAEKLAYARAPTS